MTHDPVVDRLEERRPLATIGKSGAGIDAARLDGERVIVKTIRRDDPLSRLTGGTDRLGLLWDAGVLDELPAGIDHAMLAVERTGDDWTVVMHDVGAWLVDTDRGIDASQRRRLVQAIARLHEALADLDQRVDIEALGSPAVSISLFQPSMPIEGTDDEADELPRAVRAGWAAVPDVFPTDVADAMFALQTEAPRLADELKKHQRSTFNHGDVFFANFAFPPDGFVLLDWAQLLGWGPPVIDLGMFLGYSGHLVEGGNDSVLADYRAATQSTAFAIDQAGIDLALLATIAMTGWNKALVCAHAETEEQRAHERAALEWWVAAGRRGLEHWSPSGA